MAKSRTQPSARAHRARDIQRLTVRVLEALVVVRLFVCVRLWVADEVLGSTVFVNERSEFMSKMRSGVHSKISPMSGHRALLLS